MTVFLTIFVAFCLLYFLIPQKYVGCLFFATTLALAIMAFNCVPKETDDLSNYFWQLDTLRKGGWDTFQTMLKDDNNHWGALPVCGYYFYIVSLLGNNGFLPAITIFVAYGAMFLVVYKASVRFKVNKWYLFLSCVFLLITYWFYDICSGIRNGLAFTIFITCIYFDIVEKSHRPACYIGYALCTGLHSSVIMLIILRLALAITKKYESKWVSWIMLLSITVGGNILQWLGTVSNNKYLSLLSEKADNNIGRAMDFGKTYIWVNTAVLLVVILVSLYLFKYIRESKNYKDISAFGKFHTLLLFFTVGSFTSQLIYIRIIRWIIPIMGALFFMIGMQACRDNQNKIKAVQNIKSVIKNQDGILAINELIITLLFIGFTGVHLWYTCTGSSLIWLYFKPVG